MPISDEAVLEIIRSQFSLIDDLRKENASLLEILLHKEIPQELKIQIPEGIKSLGKLPWYKRKAALESATKKPKLSEVTGVPDADNTD